MAHRWSVIALRWNNRSQKEQKDRYTARGYKLRFFIKGGCVTRTKESVRKTHPTTESTDKEAKMRFRLIQWSLARYGLSI